VQQLSGSAVVRADGRVLLLENGAQRVIRDAATGLSLDEVTAARPGQYRGCAARADGSVWCWANQADGDAQGLLGTGSGIANVTPYFAYQVRVEPGNAKVPQYLSGVRGLPQGSSSQDGALCAVTEGGELYCWGPMGLTGNLAQTGQNEAYARQIKSSKDVFVAGAVTLTVGYRHACYVDAMGQVFCWGKNIGGPLGDGTENDALYPVPVLGLSGVTRLSAGSDFTCALVGSGAEAGRVYCWGAGTFGTLGIGTPADHADPCNTTLCKRAPTRVRTGPSSVLDDVVDLTSVSDMTCALRRDQSAWCWGGVSGNYATQLEAPTGVPLPPVGLLSVHGIEPRALLTNGVYEIIGVGKSLTTVVVNCGALD
jgi:hypothetical protein